MNTQLPFELKQPQFDPRHIGMAEKKVYYLVLTGNPNRTWQFLHKRSQLFELFKDIDEHSYKHRTQVFRVEKPGKNTSSYAMLKIFDSLFDFMDEKYISRYEKYLAALDPQKNLIIKLIDNANSKPVD